MLESVFVGWSMNGVVSFESLNQILMVFFEEMTMI